MKQWYDDEGPLKYGTDGTCASDWKAWIDNPSNLGNIHSTYNPEYDDSWDTNPFSANFNLNNGDNYVRKYKYFLKAKGSYTFQFQVKCDDVCLMYKGSTLVLDRCEWSNSFQTASSTGVCATCTTSVTSGTDDEFTLYMKEKGGGDGMQWQYKCTSGCTETTYQDWPSDDHFELSNA